MTTKGERERTNAKRKTVRANVKDERLKATRLLEAAFQNSLRSSPRQRATSARIFEPTDSFLDFLSGTSAAGRVRMQKPWDLRERTMQFAVAVADYCKALEGKGVDSDTVDQLRRSSAAVAANYRAGRKGRTGKEFISKFCIAIEEADESYFWLSYLLRTGTVSDDQAKDLRQEAGELTGILIASIRTRRKNLASEEVLRKVEERRKRLK